MSIGTPRRRAPLIAMRRSRSMAALGNAVRPEPRYAGPGSVDPASTPMKCGFSASARSNELSRKPEPQAPVGDSTRISSICELRSSAKGAFYNRRDIQSETSMNQTTVSPLQESRTATIAALVCAVRHDAFDETALSAAKLLIADGIAVAVAGSAEQAPRLVAAHVR